MSDLIDPDGPTGITVEIFIYINGRELYWSQPTISYEDIVAEWNKLEPSRTVQGTPGIDWKLESGDRGVLYPNEELAVQTGLVITIDPSHLA